MFPTTITGGDYGGHGAAVVFEKLELEPNTDGVEFDIPKELEASYQANDQQ